MNYELTTPSYVAAAACSMIGGRKENQDSYGFAETPFGTLFTVCDGMGGGPGGKTASSIAVSEIISGVSEGDKEDSPSEIIAKAILRANAAILARANEETDLQGMGSTCTVLLVSEESATAAYVGDSRIYQLRGSKKLFRTFDHSMVFELVRRKAITEEEARQSAQSNVITRALGMKPQVEADIETLPFRKGDRFVMTSDGIHGTMPEKDLLSLIREGSTPEEAVKAVAEKADSLGVEKGGNHDNLTIAVIDTNIKSKLRPKMNKTARIMLAIAGIVLLAAAIGAVAFKAKAGIVSWAIKPSYGNLTRYHNNLYAFEQSGKWGLVSNAGRVILQPSSDFITPFVNGYALAGVKDGQRYLLRQIIGEDGSVTTLSDAYYLDSSKYFSEGKLPVANKNRKFGYINPMGQTVIRCQFDMALPFKEGWAPVKQGQYMKYVNANFDRDPSRSMLIVDFHYGDMTMASCFSGGQAAVAYNRDYALINMSGRVVGKLTESAFQQTYRRNNAAPDDAASGFRESAKYTVYNVDGLNGLRDAGGTVVRPQFDALGPQYSDGDIIAVMNGKYGILRVGDGTLRGHAAGSNGSTTLESRNGGVGNVSFIWDGPVGSLDGMRMYVDMGDGYFADVTSDASLSNGRASYTFTPKFASKAKNFRVRSRIENDGILLAEADQDFSVKYPAVIKVSAPGPSTVRANENNLASISASIVNDSDTPVTVSYSFSIGGSGNVTVPAHGSRGVSTTISITAESVRTVTFTAGGKSASNKIHFIPFF